MLSVRSLSRAFGGVLAIDDVGFEVRAGHVHAVIGPNGAGKTTLFNLISGIYLPSAGQVVLEGQDVTGRSPDALARLGVSRTFQNLQVCMNMTAVENVMLGAHLRLRSGLWTGLLGLARAADKRLHDESIALMHYVGIVAHRGAHATQLSFGTLKRLEIARALAAKPRLLLLDEPAAGLNDTESREMTGLIRRIADGGVTVLLVEHDMKMVMTLSDHVVVLDHGRKLADGTPTSVRSDPAVVAAYLGAANEGDA